MSGPWPDLLIYPNRTGTSAALRPKEVSLRDCARPAFALERLREIDPEHLVYESVKPGPKGSVSLMPTPMPTIDPSTHTGPTPPVETITEEPVHRQAARYAWALLLVRIYEVPPRKCGASWDTVSGSA